MFLSLCLCIDVVFMYYVFSYSAARVSINLLTYLLTYSMFLCLDVVSVTVSATCVEIFVGRETGVAEAA